eukprot:EG_transcript_12497
MATTVRVCVTGAAGLIAYALVPEIAQGRVFGPDTNVVLSLLDIPAMESRMQGLVLELEDMYCPLLKQVVATTSLETAFKGIDYCIMCGAFPRQQGMERQDLLARNKAIFQEQGAALGRFASRDVKVLVVGNPANTNALVVKLAGNLPTTNVTALTRLDQIRAAGMVARMAAASVGDVANVIIWGNHSPTMYPDLRHATVRGTPALPIVGEAAWKSSLIPAVQQRGAAVIKVRGGSSAASAAHAAALHVRDWHCGSQEVVSMGVWSDGSLYGIPEGLVFSVPCRCLGKGKYEIVRGVPIDAFSAGMLRVTAEELLKERQLALGEAAKL